MKKRIQCLLTLLLCLLLAFLPAAQGQTILSERITEIRAEAFRGDTSLTHLTLPEGILSIGERAFADSGLREIILPHTLEAIADNAFENCEGLIALVSANSYAHQYCIDHQIQFRLLEGSFGIFALFLENTDFLLTVTAEKSCTLLVEVLSEDQSTVLKALSVPVEAGLDHASLSLPVPQNYSFPSHFVLRAVLADSEGNALCNPYLTLQYTSAYEEFENIQPEDYAENVVINFGSCGFGVVADGAVMIPGATPSGGGRYTIPSSYLPQSGQVIVVPHSDGGQKPVKVESAVDNGNGTATVTEDSDVTLADLYKVFKLDGVADVGEAAQKGGIARMKKGDGEIDFITLSASYEAGPLSVSAKVTAGVTVKAFYDANLFGENYLEQQLYVKTEASFTGKLSASFDSEDLEDDAPEIPIYEGPISLIGAGAAVTSLQLKISIPLDFSFEAGGEFTVSTSQKTGYKYTTTNGCKEIKEIETDHDFKIEGAFSIQIGPEIALNADVLLGILQGSLSGQVGVRVSGVATIGSPDKNKGDSFHACSLCCNLDFALFAEARASMDFSISKKQKVDILNLQLFNTKASLGKGYLSLVNEEECLFGGKVTFGTGECPNFKYRVTVNTIGHLGDMISGLPVVILKGDAEKFSGESPGTTWLYDGDYTAKAIFESGQVKKDFTVLRDAMELDIMEAKAHVVGTVWGRSNNTQAESKPIPGAELAFQCTSDASCSRNVTADENGDYEAELEIGEYQVTVSGGSEYEPNTFPLSVRSCTPFEKDYTLKLLEGSVAGLISNQESGQILSGASLTIKDADYYVVWEGNTDTGGTYLAYLLPGSYTIQASKTGFESATFSFSVNANERTLVNGALKPLTACDPPVVTFHYNGHTYAIHNCAVSWQLASDYCNFYGGHLVTFTDMEENAAIVANLPSSPKNCYWIGLYGSAGNGWNWVTGEPLNFSNWAANEPNNEQNKGEGCVHIFGKKYTGGKGTKYPGDWNDTTNTGAGYASSFYAQGNFGFICEWDEVR